MLGFRIDVEHGDESTASEGQDSDASKNQDSEYSEDDKVKKSGRKASVASEGQESDASSIFVFISHY
jgi:hypothetical protein